MVGKNVELLAPAGNYQAFVGALNAGADAVYLGGDKFSARAYADNFTDEEILKALRYAHFNGKKLYLTLNTLVKEKEFPLIYDYVRQFYEAGLDGIIIQDLGVWKYVKAVFPDLPLHASTQMTVTGAMGASLLKGAGAARIVPARELSLGEIRAIKEETGLEIECFIHGAMCYCYSGQCLFSSILGGRSGNRGRCAQPCRLPYTVSGPDNNAESGELYPLSLKDMCTIECIPQLIEAGIDSFKIEGRMKKPEYAAGTTAIYRKYIDRYYEKGAGSYCVDKYDMDRLYKLYIRSEVQTGYYGRYNGREMITLGKGSYLRSDDALLEEISRKYLKEEKKLPISISGTFNAGETAVFSIEGMGITQTSYGDTIQPALKRPMAKEEVLKQLKKTGSSFVGIAAENITVGENVFIPIAKLNELRRHALVEFEDKVIESKGFASSRKMTLNLQKFHKLDEDQPAEDNSTNEKIYEKPIKTANPVNSPDERLIRPKLHINVQNIQQLWTVCQYPCDRVYIDSDLYIREFDQVSQCLENHTHFEIFLSLPLIIREKDSDYLEELEALLSKNINGIKGFLVRNLEELYWVNDNLPAKTGNGNEYETVIDSSIYCFNAEAVRFLRKYMGGVCEFYLPWELNGRECRQLADKLIDLGMMGNHDYDNKNGIRISMPIYSTIPMMVTANCIKKTINSCVPSNPPSHMYLTDRYNAKFPVLCNCRHCYNIIYNSVPYSLHQEWKAVRRLGLFAVRLDFIFEKEAQIKKILDYYTGKSVTFPAADYTAGHYKRGVE